MSMNKLFPCVLIAPIVLALSTLNIAAQTASLRPRQVAQTTTINGTNCLEDDLSVPSDEDEVEAVQPATLLKPSIVTSGLVRVDHMLLSAIDQRLGAPYVFGATGPRVFDCSGFVWSVFQSAGVRFERVSARSLWAQFAPAREDEKFKLGTLVFFNNLRHVGIVADEHGFYHASSSHGVTYSTFNDYWTSRIVGFRRVPMPVQNLAE